MIELEKQNDYLDLNEYNAIANLDIPVLSLDGYDKNDFIITVSTTENNQNSRITNVINAESNKTDVLPIVYRKLAMVHQDNSLI